MDGHTSPESAADAAPLEHPSLSPAPSNEDDKDKTTHLRFLVSNTEAGCIIGKNGSTINEFQSSSGARIQLSRSHEFFPGTSDRIIMVSGLFEDVIKAMEMILDKMLVELQREEKVDVEPKTKVRLVVPNSCCGGIIGKGGATIKSIIEDSHAGIKISPQDNAYASSMHDRLVTITGSYEQQMQAIQLILLKLSEDAHYPPNLSSPFPYGGVSYSGYPGVQVGYMIQPVAYNPMNYRANGQGRYANNRANAPVRSPSNYSSQSDSHTFGVPDERIGAVVGRGGRIITEISQVSGARIKISDKGDFIDGTSDRKVTITGSPEAIQTAEAMIRQRVAASADR